MRFNAFKIHLEKTYLFHHIRVYHQSHLLLSISIKKNAEKWSFIKKKTDYIQNGRSARSIGREYFTLWFIDKLEE